MEGQKACYILLKFAVTSRTSTCVFNKFLHYAMLKVVGGGHLCMLRCHYICVHPNDMEISISEIGRYKCNKQLNKTSIIEATFAVVKTLNPK